MNLIHGVIMQKRSTWRVWVLLIDLTSFSCFRMECMLKAEVTIMVIPWRIFSQNKKGWGRDFEWLLWWTIVKLEMICVGKKNNVRLTLVYVVKGLLHMFNCKRRKWEMNCLFFVVLIILNKDINVCSMEKKAEKFQGNEFLYFD